MTGGGAAASGHQHANHTIPAAPQPPPCPNPSPAPHPLRSLVGVLAHDLLRDELKVVILKVERLPQQPPPLVQRLPRQAPTVQPQQVEGHEHVTRAARLVLPLGILPSPLRSAVAAAARAPPHPLLAVVAVPVACVAVRGSLLPKGKESPRRQIHRRHLAVHQTVRHRFGNRPLQNGTHRILVRARVVFPVSAPPLHARAAHAAAAASHRAAVSSVHGGAVAAAGGAGAFPPKVEQKAIAVQLWLDDVVALPAHLTENGGGRRMGMMEGGRGVGRGHAWNGRGWDRHGNEGEGAWMVRVPGVRLRRSRGTWRRWWGREGI
jgi:hypothetical protein